jgi:WD40 repeat protein
VVFVAGEPISRVCLETLGKPGNLVSVKEEKDSLCVRDIASGEEVLKIPQGPGLVRTIALSPDGTALVSACENCNGTMLIQLWDPTTGRQLAAFEPDLNEAITHLTFSQDGRRIVSLGDDHEVAILDAATGRKLITLGHEDEDEHEDEYDRLAALVRRALSVDCGAGLAISPDGKTLAVATFDKVRVYETGSDHD